MTGTLAEALRHTAQALRACGCRFALVGRIAVSSRREPRFTRDIDFAIAVADGEQAEALVF